MSRRDTGWSQRHATRTLIDPDGQVEIDLEMIPLVEAPWAAGYTTIMSCQDLGESIRTAIPEPRGSVTALTIRARPGAKPPPAKGPGS